MGDGAPRRRRLRVLLLTDTLATGGAELVTARIAAGLDRERFETILCATRSAAGGAADDVRDAGVRVVSLGRRSKVDLWRLLPLLRLLRRERVDIVHAHKHGSNIWGTVLGRLARVPVVIAH
jgi:hypothetical protein